MSQHTLRSPIVKEQDIRLALDCIFLFRQFFILVFAVLYVIYPTPLKAQENTCSTDKVHEELLSSDAIYRQNREEIKQFVADKLKAHKADKSTSTGIITIPVVFHLFIKEPIEEISTPRLRFVLQKVTEDFRFENDNVPNIRPVFDGIGADIELEFCLATTDPKGKATLGYTKHYYDPNSIWFQNSIRIHTSKKGGQDPWNSDHYLNIYVYDDGSTAYAKRPGSPKHLDGVVLGFLSPLLGSHEIVSHEIGHWLDLNHTFWNGCDAPGDGIEDTPAALVSSGCTTANTCNTGANDLPDMNENIMSYSNCRTMFTNDQKVAMRSHLEPGGWRDQIVNSQGCSLPSQLIPDGNWRVGSCGLIANVGFSTFSNLISNYTCSGLSENGAEAIWEIRLNAPQSLIISLGDPNAHIYILNEYTDESCILFSETSPYTTPVLQDGIYYVVIEDSGLTNGTTTLNISCDASPENDLCNDAILLDVEETCLYNYDYHSLNAGSSFGCNPVHDIWFKFKNPTSGSIRFEAEYALNQDYYPWSSKVTFYEGVDCDGLSEIFCDTNVGSVSPYSPYTISGLVPGDFSYIQVSGPQERWRICLSKTPTPPINDECAGAVYLDSGSLCDPYRFHHVGATRSVLPDELCPTFTNNTDTWYKTVIPPSGDLIIETGVGHTNYILAKLFTGTCGDLTNLTCEPTTYRASKAYFNVQNEVPGTEVYILLTSYTGPVHPDGIPYDMEVCAFEPRPIENEICEEAIPLPVNSECQSMHLEIHNAKLDGSPSFCTIDGSTQLFRRDVWYSFEMPSTGIIEIDAIGHTYTDRIIYEILSGHCGIELVSEFCDSYQGHKINHFTGIPGQEYFLRFGMDRGRFFYGTLPLDIDLCLTEKECMDLQVEIHCENYSTASALDDSYTFDLCVEAYTGNLLYNISGDVNASMLPISQVQTVDNGGSGFLISNGPVTIQITDVDDPNCVKTITVVPPDECPNCDLNLLQTDFPSIYNSASVHQHIETNGVVPSNKDVIYSAGDWILFNEHFEVKQGALFLAQIAPCQ